MPLAPIAPISAGPGGFRLMTPGMPSSPLRLGSTPGSSTGTSGATGTSAHPLADGAPTTSIDPAKAAGGSMLDRDAFLKLLVAQLKYQDPTKPMDASAMIAQSAQLSVVEELNQISTLLERTAVTDRLTLAGSVIGKAVTFVGPDGYAVTETVRSVRFEEGSLVLATDNWEVPIESVAAIGGAPTAAPAPAPSAPAPSDPAPVDPAPTDTAPADTAPADGAPTDTTPADTTPADGAGTATGTDETSSTDETSGTGPGPSVGP